MDLADSTNPPDPNPNLKVGNVTPAGPTLADAVGMEAL